MNAETNYNRLSEQKSLYLKQHIDNPVHWWPYSEEAILMAKEENKPIFLSIGYSSCHWCHVMSNESFSDQETADYLNQNFVCIKVDREELPDLDNYYQKACQLFTKQGGWPLSAFLLPDMKPYFVGTFFSKAKNGNAPTFMEVLNEMTRAFTDNKEEILKTATDITAQIKEGFVPKDKVEFPGHFPSPMAIMEATKEYRDNENGGFGGAPKFPNFTFFEWAVEQILEGMMKDDAAEFVVKSIENMLMGGIIDHAKGGIHRYSVDPAFKVPHFEKMLYSQAGLLKLLSKFSLIHPSPLVFDSILNTLEYLQTEMLSEGNFLFSAQDSDSEGVEGLYYTFTVEEFEDCVNACDDETMSSKLEEYKKWFNITKEGNFQHNLNVISLDPKNKDDYFTQESWDSIRKIRKELLNERKNRIPPKTDNKGVASWNFYMLSALCDVMQYCKIDIMKRLASNLLNSILEGQEENFIKQDSQGKMQLLHTTSRGSDFPLFEDYCFMAESQLRIYEVTGHDVFKKNFENTMNFIFEDFIEGDEAFTRPIKLTDSVSYPNELLSSIDTSYKSPLSTFVLLSRRSQVLLPESELAIKAQKLKEVVIHEALKNPINSGEALRALCYPDEAYRVLKVHKDLLKDPEFINVLPYFLTRFVFDYHEGEVGFWQICTAKECEVQGTSKEELLQTILPKKPE